MHLAAAQLCGGAPPAPAGAAPAAGGARACAQRAGNGSSDSGSNSPELKDARVVPTACA
jgi:hypothetical protein